MTDKAAEPVRKMDAHDLYRALDRFFSDNSRGYSIEERWLAQQVIPLKSLAHQFWANGITPFAEKNKEGITALRLAEIDEERSKLSKADAKLKDEEKRLLRTRTAHLHLNDDPQ